jgi:hypothetical protein
MKRNLNQNTVVAIAVSLSGMLAGCQTSVPDSEAGPEKTAAYYIKVESSEPGVTIETNKVYAGQTPLTFKVFGDSPGAFHDFGRREYTVRALPLTTNQFLQTRVFRTGKASALGDRIPGFIFFDMSRQGGEGFLIDSIPDK